MRVAGCESTCPAVRSMASFTILTIFLLYFFSAGVSALPFSFDLQPDFSRYIKTSALNISSSDQPTRLLFVGDVHGRFEDLQHLLRKVNYDPAAGDTLVHTGDTITKSSVLESKKVLEWMAAHDVAGVRGNHDQAVIDWKGWRDWISSTSAGKAWLHSLDRDWENENSKTSSNALDPIDWAKERRKNSPRKHKSWWRRVPRGWKMFNEHYLIAASLEQREYEYLLSLPLVLHIPSIHTFTVHAGILASDVSRPATDRHQPLARHPNPPRSSNPTVDETALRFLQESAILNDIPQNNEPWVMLNMRSILKDNTIIRRNKKGHPWTRDYNEIMDRCVGYGANFASDSTAKKGLPCMPATVVYGHAAARGLDINRWSFGLDSGCAYGRKLSALVLELPPHHASYIQEEEDNVEEIEETMSHDPNEETQEIFARPQQRKIKFGDDDNLIKASIVDVDCSG
ncbi:calcineurin-like phosphoesterase [Thelephora terrestris]|uniref:Calcineurin-like phosphoesterase n=1 Tax=Thelephora terrestris TaxID=56493 RepID=A0A9P6LA60_9AGAM|nr:calcineurin-like phosphoesterase [Thelephora terrestris]